jgi:probable rRNA maturation factor
MNSPEEPDPPGIWLTPPRGAAAREAFADRPRLIRRHRKIPADWDEVQAFLDRLPAALAPSPFTVCLLSDRSIRGYNLRFRRKNEATDVLSFPMRPFGRQAQDYLGDILISVDTADRSARGLGLRLEDEIKVLILHGLLHLRGEDHERDAGRMARLERRWASRLGLPQPLLIRASGNRRPARRWRSSAKSRGRRGAN